MDIAKSNKEKKSLLRQYHKDTLRALHAEDNQYCPHMAFSHNGEQYMKFFPGELNMKKDLYTESVSRDFEPEDSERHLLVLKYGPHWNKYEQEQSNYKMYLVPVADMQLAIPEVHPDNNVTIPHTCEDMVNTGQDWIISDMTLLDLAAILWRKPVSCKAELNSLISREFKE